MSDGRPDLVELDSLFARALHRDSDSRFEKPEDFRRALRQAIGADVVPAVSEVPTGSRRNPYKGLRAFKESEAIDFHGRDSLVEELVESLASRRLITVVGPSGSGKSSLVRAGLLPAIRSGAIQGSKTWLIAEMFPGTHPFEELTAALLRIATDRPSGMFDELTADDRGLARAAKMIIGNDEDELVILVDQFEELFSLVSSESTRRLFLDSLTAVATDDRSRIRVVLTLRADFFDQPLQYPDFAEVMSSGLVPVSPPGDEGLTRAIVQPARGVGVDLQPGLVTRIIDDVRDEPGGLPLMQYALTELFSNQVNNTMTLGAYEQSGGVAGALANRAEEIYGNLTTEGRTAARNLFLRLVNVDELADDTRRRVRQTELKGLSLDQTILDDVIQQFAAFRLLSFDRDAATRTPTVEVAHEALIREWARLRTWIDEGREDLLIHRRIQVTVRDWEDSDKDPSYLLRGSRLEQALIWQERTDLAVSDDEMTFIEASIEQEKRDQAEHQALEEKASRRRKAVIVALAGGLIVAGVLGAVALDRAEEARVEAARATSQELSAAALLAVEEDPELAVLLALEAFGATDELDLDPTSESISALMTTRRELRVALRIPGGFQAISYSRSGELIALDGNEPEDTRTFIVDASTGETLGNLKDPANTGGRPSFIGLSPDDESVAVARDYFTSKFIDGLDDDVEPAELRVAGVDLYDPNTHSHQISLLGPPGFYTAASFGPDDLVASSWGLNSANSGALVWDRRSGGIVFDLEPASSGEMILSAEFLPGTTSLLIAYGLPGPGGGFDHGRIDLVDLNEDIVVGSFEVDIVPDRTSVSPNGKLVALTDAPARTALVLEMPTGDIVRRIGHPSPQALAWSPDSTALSVSGNESDVTIYSVDNDSDPVVLTGHSGSVWGTSFSPDGTRIASASLDGTARVWDLTPAGLGGEDAYSIGGTPSRFSIDPEGEYVFASRLGGGAALVEIGSGSIVQEYPLEVSFPFVPWANAPISRTFGTHSDTGNGVILDADSGEILHEWECLTPRVVSPSGALAVLDGQLACTPDEGATFSRVVDLESGQVLLDLGERVIMDGEFSPRALGEDGGYLVINAQDLEIELYSLPELEKVGEMDASEYGNAFLQLHIDPQSKYLGLGAVGGVVGVVDLQAVSNGQSMFDALVLHAEGHKSNVIQVRSTSSGVVVSAAFDGFYRVWDIGTGERLFEIRAPGLGDPRSAFWTNDGQTLGYQDASGHIRLTSVDAGDVVAQARAALTRSLTDAECRQYLHTDGCVDQDSSLG
ncbi:hypothetical protein BH23ACT4_BH23ACT4_11830 [soil metagenome]